MRSRGWSQNVVAKNQKPRGNFELIGGALALMMKETDNNAVADEAANTTTDRTYEGVSLCVFGGIFGSLDGVLGSCVASRPRRRLPAAEIPHAPVLGITGPSSLGKSTLLAYLAYADMPGTTRR